MRVFIKGMDKKPESCESCSFCNITGDCLPLATFFGSYEDQYKNCPLEEKAQPNPFDSVVQLLLDFDLGSEWDGDVRELAQYICDMFKDGAYD